MTDGKREIIRQLLTEYDIKTAEDIQDALKDLLGGTIKEMMETEIAATILDEVEEKWKKKYPCAMKSWRTIWESIIPIFKFSPTLRKVIYTTNAIESLNAMYRQLNRQRSVFPNNTTFEDAVPRDRTSHQKVDNADT